MSWSNVTATLIGGSNVSTTLTTTNWPDAMSQVTAMGLRGFWIANAAAGIVYNQYIPATAILSLTVI
jgi:hypothetical protein